MAARAYKRRRLLVDRVQLQLLGITLLYFVATVTVFAVALFTPAVLALVGGEATTEQQSLAASQFLALHTRFWPALLVTFVVLAFHSVLTSHRIAGPLYRFRHVYGEIRDGNLAPWIGVRRRDFLSPDAAALEEMAASLRDRLRSIGEHHDVARRRLGELQRSLATGDLDAARAQLEDSQRDLAVVGRGLAAFRLTPERDRP